MVVAGAGLFDVRADEETLRADISRSGCDAAEDFHKVGVAPVDGVCSTDIVVVAPHNSLWFGFVLCHISSEKFVEYTNAGSTGTKMPRTSWGDMARYAIVVPPKTVAKAFTEQLQPFIDRINAGIHESHTLAALRDTLLPKLISGELRVKEVAPILGV